MQPLWACATRAKQEMTTRAFVTSVVRKGKQLFQHVGKAKTQKVEAKVGRIQLQQKVPQVHVSRVQSQYTSSRLHGAWQKSVRNQYFQSLASHLGRRGFYKGGRNLPFLAFAGLVFAQKSDSEKDEVVDRIHNFVKAANKLYESPLTECQCVTLNQLELGGLLGQGCNAAVYEARLRSDTVIKEVAEEVLEEQLSESAIDSDTDISVLRMIDDEVEDEEKAPTVFDVHTDDVVADYSDSSDTTSEADSDISFLSMSDDDLEEEDKAPLLFPVTVKPEIETDSEYSMLSDENLDDDWLTDVEESISQSEPVSDESGVSDVESAWPPVTATEEKYVIDTDETDVPPVFDMFQQLPVMTDSDVVMAQRQEHATEQNLQYNSLDSHTSQDLNDRHFVEGGKYELAVKMMFNYDIVSNSDKILRGMSKEMVPARLAGSPEQFQAWRNGHKVRLKQLPAHPNIVDMLGVFVDSVPDLPDALMNYPAALPTRINSNGLGRNMTMFLVMKKYSMTLSEYLSIVHLSVRERLYLLVQLLEAVDHMVQHCIAHRDIKSDNILIDTARDGPPQLVLCDFGCCLADPNCGLRLPYPTEEVDRGGNSALMAPEISSAEPGIFVSLDYSKADLWSVGALAYEILGADNPFYTSSRGNKLDSRSYSQSDLPPLPSDTPRSVQNLVATLLRRDPSHRPSTRLAADILHFHLWAPCHWLLPGYKVTRSEVRWWLATMATEVNLETLKCFNKASTLSSLKCCFVEKFSMNRARKVLDFLNMGTMEE